VCVRAHVDVPHLMSTSCFLYDLCVCVWHDTSTLKPHMLNAAWQKGAKLMALKNIWCWSFVFWDNIFWRVSVINAFLWVSNFHLGLCRPDITFYLKPAVRLPVCPIYFRLFSSCLLYPSLWTQTVGKEKFQRCQHICSEKKRLGFFV